MVGMTDVEVGCRGEDVEVGCRGEDVEVGMYGKVGCTCSVVGVRQGCDYISMHM